MTKDEAMKVIKELVGWDNPTLYYDKYYYDPGWDEKTSHPGSKWGVKARNPGSKGWWYYNDRTHSFERELPR